jgi:hypothetical protein
MRLKPDDLPSILSRPGYSLPTGIVSKGLRHPEPKQDDGVQSLGADQDEKGSPGRFKVCIERRGARLLDVDNLYGSVKFVCDALRYEKIIPEDNPEAIELHVTQRQVKKPDRGTFITVEKIVD